MCFGDHLAKARKAAGMTQADLAKRLSISVRAIQHYEQGRSTPPLPKLQKIVEILGVSLSYFEANTNLSDRDKGTFHVSEKASQYGKVEHIMRASEKLSPAAHQKFVELTEKSLEMAKIMDEAERAHRDDNKTDSH
ncbi:MAG: helix-turn-helix domain-containing protein [Bacilli bacterium]